MKAKKHSAVLLTLVALVTGVVLVAGVANAAPPAPTTPYPNPNPNAVAVGDACDLESNDVAQAQLTYNEAFAAYGDQQTASNKGVGSPQDLRAAQTALDVASITLNTTTYALATCQNTAVNKVNKDCVNLALELNRLVDQLAITQDLEALAKANFDEATKAFNAGTLGAAALRTAKYGYDLAKTQTAKVQLLITAQRKKIPADCTNVDRPPLAPPPHVPASTDTPPTDTAIASTPTDSPSDTTTPSDTTSTSPVPIPSAS